VRCAPLTTQQHNNNTMSISMSEYARATAITVHGALFQRLGMAHLGAVDAVGGAPDSVRGLTVVVTGPTAGIGRATAAALARRGAHGECFWNDGVMM
jgi:hypothetical protein